MEECANNLGEKKLDALWAIDWDFPRCRGIDTRTVLSPSQSLASIFQKRVFLLCRIEIPKWELDARMQINRHDEYQKFLI